MFYLYQGTGELERNADAYTGPLGSCSFKICLLLFGVVGPDCFCKRTRF